MNRSNQLAELAEILIVGLVSIVSLLVAFVLLMVDFVQLTSTADPDFGRFMARFGTGILLLACSSVIHHLVKKLNRLAAATQKDQEGAKR